MTTAQIEATRARHNRPDHLEYLNLRVEDGIMSLGLDVDVIDDEGTPAVVDALDFDDPRSLLTIAQAALRAARHGLAGGPTDTIEIEAHTPLPAYLVVIESYLAAVLHNLPA